MPNTTYFVQGCPTCGRRLHIRVEYLGKKLVCDHCHGRFVARDTSNLRTDLPETESEILRRADALLQSLEMLKAHRPDSSAN